MSEVAAIVRVLIYAFKARLITSTYTETSTQTQTHAHKRTLAYSLTPNAVGSKVVPSKLHINCSLIVD